MLTHLILVIKGKLMQVITSDLQLTLTTKLKLRWLSMTAKKVKCLCAHICPQGKVNCQCA